MNLLQRFHNTIRLYKDDIYLQMHCKDTHVSLIFTSLIPCLTVKINSLFSLSPCLTFYVRQMSWHSTFHCSKFRHVIGRPATREHCYDRVPITRSVHDNHNCSANPCFIAVVTECVGGGSFLVLPIHHVCKTKYSFLDD